MRTDPTTIQIIYNRTSRNKWMSDGRDEEFITNHLVNRVSTGLRNSISKG